MFDLYHLNLVSKVQLISTHTIFKASRGVNHHPPPSKHPIFKKPHQSDAGLPDTKTEHSTTTCWFLPRIGIKYNRGYLTPVALPDSRLFLSSTLPNPVIESYSRRVGRREPRVMRCMRRSFGRWRFNISILRRQQRRKHRRKSFRE